MSVDDSQSVTQSVAQSVSQSVSASLVSIGDCVTSGALDYVGGSLGLKMCVDEPVGLKK